MKRSFTISQINEAANWLIDSVGARRVIAFDGEMGAGKTTLITALCRSLGVAGTIGSPTYSIINQYKTLAGEAIYHMDWYRLKDEEEAFAAGVEDPMYSGNFCFIEWPAKAPALLPADTVHVRISVLDDQSRELAADLKIIG